MLILARNKDESIIIKTPTHEIEVMVTDSRGKVRLGFKADEDVVILRKELDKDDR